MVGSRRAARVLASALVGTACLGACSKQAPTITENTALSWSQPIPTNSADLPGQIPPNTAGRKAAPDGKVWHMTLRPKEAPVDDSQWPDANSLFSPSELKAIFPDGKDIAVSDCDRGTWYSGDKRGDETSKNTKCKIKVTMPDDSTPSTVNVAIEGFGADFAMTERFDKERAQARTNAEKVKLPDQYVFYRDGAFGAKKLYRDGSTTTILISDGTVAGQFSLSFIGFFDLVKDDYTASDKARYTQLMPLFVQTLAAHLPRAR